MAPTISTKQQPDPTYTDQQRQALLRIAYDSIQYALTHHTPMQVVTEDYEEKLREQRACFVTLEKQHELRGCIGTLEAYRPLIEDVVENAYAAAFRDPRFPPVTVAELDQLTLHLSILTPPEAMTFESEQDLLNQLQPGIDGLILLDGTHRSTFLPTVWKSLTTPEAFIQRLKVKAGLPYNYWSNTIQFQRYHTELIASPD